MKMKRMSYEIEISDFKNIKNLNKFFFFNFSFYFMELLLINKNIKIMAINRKDKEFIIIFTFSK